MTAPDASSLRILFTVQPGYGHLHPLVPLARAAQDAGHEVLVATSASMCPAVVAAGLPCVAAGLDWLLADEQRAFPDMAGITYGDAHFRLQLTRVFRDVTPRRMLPDLLDLCRAWRPDVIVRDDQELAGLIAAEQCGIPHAVAGVLWLYPPDLQQVVVDATDALLADAGLSGIPPLERAYRYLTLASMPAAWPAPDEYLPVTTHLQRPVAYEQPDDIASGMEGLGLPDAPLIHANLGTIVTNQTTLVDDLLRAFHDAPYNLVVSVGPHHDVTRYGPQPAHVRILNHIPRDVLDHCALAVVHAGYGSTMAAMAHGVPMLLLPVAADQPRNARRCVALGVGVALFDGERPPERIREVADDVLTNPKFASRSRALAADIDALPGPESGVGMLEHLARNREPLVEPDKSGSSARLALPTDAPE